MTLETRGLIHLNVKQAALHGLLRLSRRACARAFRVRDVEFRQVTAEIPLSAVPFHSRADAVPRLRCGGSRCSSSSLSLSFRCSRSVRSIDVALLLFRRILQADCDLQLLRLTHFDRSMSAFSHQSFKSVSTFVGSRKRAFGCPRSSTVASSAGSTSRRRSCRTRARHFGHGIQNRETNSVANTIEPHPIFVP
jgi:hypothetical protein